MSSIVVAGDTSGSITISAPLVAGTTTLTLPSTTGIVPIQDSATGALTLPVGTTAQRPTPVTGMTRFNSTTSVMEYYNGAVWYIVTATNPTPTVEYLVIGGGGSGNRGYINSGTSVGGGGGGGGYRTAANFPVASGTDLTVTVGLGGVWTVVQDSSAPGADSVFSTITATGGGGGGMQSRDGGSGGSGGGGGGVSGAQVGGAGNTPSTTPSQGNAGGAGSASFGGGGGGSSSAGGTPTKGNGTASSISGSSTTYAAGGIGGQTNVQGAAGSTNTGNGADGGPQGTGATGNNGGSGIVIIRYADTYSAATSTTGSPTITVAGGYRVYKWTASGTITF